MAIEVKLPRLGQGMESGTIVRWFKAEGDAVAKGEPLYEVDTEKVTQEVEAEASGMLLRIVVPVGEVPVGTTLALVGEPGEQLAAEPAAERLGVVETATAERPRGPVPDEARMAGVAVGEQAVEAPPIRPPSKPKLPTRPKASPLARRLARERGIDLAALIGTGPEGRIVAEDVERAAAVGAPPESVAPAAEVVAGPPVAEIPLTSTQKTVVRRLAEAWETPVFQLTLSARMDQAEAVVAARRTEEEVKVTLTDLLVKMCSVALLDHRAVNSQFAGETVRVFSTANIGIAVAAPQGLVVPVIRSVEGLRLAEIAAARRDIVERARAGKLQAADLEGGTFTISNLGMYGVEQFVAVLNPPQAAILAVGMVEERPVVEGEQVVVRPMMTMTLSCDHRALDGTAAARFLTAVKQLLESPGLAL
jgi:pyruvate dehydrogenase E2 component (dihydrolipoamide acetyltransferase)